jgi:kynurenine formamidase
MSGAEPSASLPGPQRPTGATVQGWAGRLSNHGRWGTEDRLGTLNLVDDEVRRRAFGGVEHGRVIACGRRVTASAWPTTDAMARRFLVRDGHPEAGIDPSHAGGTHAAEYVGLVFHGPGVTHLDALSHVYWNGVGYNGLTPAALSIERGATRLAITDLAEGIATRGVLVDGPTLCGVERLEPGHGVTADDVLAAEERFGFTVGSGDFLLLRTGATGGAPAPGGARPGWDASILPFLHEREVAALGCDTPNDVRPSGRFGGGPEDPIHLVGVATMGLWLLDNADLEALAGAARRYGRWTFLFLVANLLLEGGTGSPVNPLAVF